MDNSDQSDDFIQQLHRIEFQSMRLAESATENVDISRDLLNEKACELMIAVIRFFSTSLRYFSRSFSSKFSNLRDC